MPSAITTPDKKHDPAILGYPSVPSGANELLLGHYLSQLEWTASIGTVALELPKKYTPKSIGLQLLGFFNAGTEFLRYPGQDTLVSKTYLEDSLWDFYCVNGLLNRADLSVNYRVSPTETAWHLAHLLLSNIQHAGLQERLLPNYLRTNIAYGNSAANWFSGLELGNPPRQHIDVTLSGFKAGYGITHSSSVRLNPKTDFTLMSSEGHTSPLHYKHKG